MRLIVACSSPIVLSGIFVIFICVLHESANGHIASTTIHHVQSKNPNTNGFWEKNITWKSRWVKSWTTKKYYIPIWKNVWGPVVHNEWIPLAKPPPGWLPPPQ